MICNRAIDCNFERQRHKQIDSTPQGAQQEQREQVRPVPPDLLKDPRIQPGSKTPGLPSIRRDRSLETSVHVDPLRLQTPLLMARLPQPCTCILCCSTVAMSCAPILSSITADARPHSRTVLQTNRSAPRASRMDVVAAPSIPAPAENRASMRERTNPGAKHFGQMRQRTYCLPA